jgi:hypothetical protein
MRYLLMICLDEASYAALSPEEAAASMAEYGEFYEAMGARDVLQGGERLRPTSDATTVRVRDGEVVTFDGPFAETKEQLAGFYIIEARDLNDAIQLAAKIPPAREGSIEVRPVRQLDTQTFG